MRKNIAVILAALLVLLCAAPALAADSTDGFGQFDHVFIIGVDGLGAMWETLDSPNFDRIFGNSAYRYNAKTETVTISAQNWGAILTGTDADTHGMTNSSIEQAERTSDNATPTIFYYVRQQYPDALLTSFTNWYPINTGMIETDLGVEKIDGRGVSVDSVDAYLTDQIVSYLNAGNAPKLFFLQFDEPDHAAHTYGADSEQYRQTCMTADTLMGRIYDAAASNGLMENGLFIVVADHGEIGYGHGGQSVQESSVVLGVAGKGVSAFTLPETVRNRDVAAIALHALGVAQPGHMTAAVPAGLFSHTHVYDDGVVIQNATCTAQGQKRFSCDCGDSYLETIPATGHKDADNDGICDVCSAQLRAQTDDSGGSDFDWSSFWNAIRSFWTRLFNRIKSLFTR